MRNDWHVRYVSARLRGSITDSEACWLKSGKITIDVPQCRTLSFLQQQSNYSCRWLGWMREYHPTLQCWTLSRFLFYTLKQKSSSGISWGRRAKGKKTVERAQLICTAMPQGSAFTFKPGCPNILCELFTCTTYKDWRTPRAWFLAPFCF